MLSVPSGDGLLEITHCEYRLSGTIYGARHHNAASSNSPTVIVFLSVIRSSQSRSRRLSSSG